MKTKKIIAIDFDDTITNPSPFPITGDLNKEAEKYINLLYMKGYKLILWTSRSGDYYKEACNLIKKWNLPILCDHTNKYTHGTTGKLVADFYIDDKSCLGKLKWKKIYKFILNNV